jgi:hypothetical protein
MLFGLGTVAQLDLYRPAGWHDESHAASPEAIEIGYVRVFIPIGYKLNRHTFAARVVLHPARDETLLGLRSFEGPAEGKDGRGKCKGFRQHMTLPAWAASALGSAVATTEVDADPRLCRFRYACNFAIPYRWQNRAKAA